MKITIDTLRLSPECVVALANAVSKDIESFAATGGLSVTENDYHAIIADLGATFDQLCAAVEEHGLVLSDHVTCPDYDI